MFYCCRAPKCAIKRFCSTLNILQRWQWHVTQKYKENALLLSIVTMDTRKRNSVMLYVHARPICFENGSQTLNPQSETSKPQWETSKPQGETSKPQSETSKPQSETSKPQSDNQNRSQRHLNRSQRHLNRSHRHRNRSQRHINRSERHLTAVRDT